MPNPAYARHARDDQWRFMERVALFGVLWWCIWNKNGRLEREDEERDCLISGMERQEWMQAHSDWWIVGEWDEERYARPVRLTAAGQFALANRHLYDMEPVTGGLIDPGWSAVPAINPDVYAQH